jgi:hypothetical protein
MTCDRCGRDLHAPEEPLLCDGCDFPEGMCDCKPIEEPKVIGPPPEEERKPLVASPLDRRLDA